MGPYSHTWTHIHTQCTYTEKLFYVTYGGKYEEVRAGVLDYYNKHATWTIKKTKGHLQAVSEIPILSKLLVLLWALHKVADKGRGMGKSKNGEPVVDWEAK